MPSAKDVGLKESAFETGTTEINSETSSRKNEPQVNVDDLGEAVRDPGPIGPAISSFWKKKADRLNLEEVATQKSVFDNPNLATYFKPNSDYENVHLFDPSERWTWAEELPLVRKMDWKVTAWACVAFFALDLPRGNISQANTDNFLEDLGLGTNDYNLGQTLFRTAFLLAELPSQLISKRLGPDIWIPAQMIMWSIVAGSQFFLTGRASFLTCRVLIGMLQGGFIPDIILYLSYFFKSAEMPFRLALFWMCMRMTDVVAPLIAAGVLQMRGVDGREGWRWLFLIEGILTLSIGIWSCFQMVPSISQTKARWRPNGWFTPREEKIAVNRVLRDDPSKGDMHNREGISLKLLWRALCDYNLWPIYALGLTFGVPFTTQDQYYTLTLRGLNFNTLQSNLLTIPAQFGTTITMLTCTYLSERLGQRSYFGIFAQIWMLPGIISLIVIPASTARWSMYAIVTIILSYPYPHPMHVAWTSRHSNSVGTRTVSAALYNMSVQLSNIIAYNIFREDDAPLYRRGNKVLTGFGCLTIVLYILTKVYYNFQNIRKRKMWNALSPEQQKEYLESTTDEGSKRLDFVYVS
ncbi:hypothetical protein LTR37_006462 [Vermiconidia calcicola]|uniref:Uncharacterized protein n=1 Tax=Vermiconidia calcicola TaxID=1690605 RepID=A0ACC3NG10_9PEZI|nr:hypothetical protein LTR37_006462 [Vermiconidia calcicola]